MEPEAVHAGNSLVMRAHSLRYESFWLSKHVQSGAASARDCKINEQSKGAKACVLRVALQHRSARLASCRSQCPLGIAFCSPAGFAFEQLQDRTVDRIQILCSALAYVILVGNALANFELVIA